MVHLFAEGGQKVGILADGGAEGQVTLLNANAYLTGIFQRLFGNDLPSLGRKSHFFKGEIGGIKAHFLVKGKACLDVGRNILAGIAVEIE